MCDCLNRMRNKLCFDVTFSILWLKIATMMVREEIIKLKNEMEDKNDMNIHVSKKKDNCLSLFKLIAALQVMFGHIIMHLEISNTSWFSKLFGVFQGVPIFFTLSGFLIWFSIERAVNRGGYSKYIRNRFWRIYPEMWVAIAVEIIVLCILYRGWNVRDTALFALTQSTIFQFWTPASLRGYGCGTPNGSLWTMCVLIQFYIIAWFVYKLLKNKKWFVWVIIIVTSILVSQLGEVAIGLFQKEMLLKLYQQTIIRYLWMFLLGMGIACFFDKVVPLCKKWWLVFIGAGAIVSISGFDFSVGYGVLKTIFILLAIVGFSYRFPNLKLKRDISFGIFIYHMTVVNIMIAFGLTGKFIYLMIATIITCVLGYISTITIGEYSAKRKVE